MLRQKMEAMLSKLKNTSQSNGMPEQELTIDQVNKELTKFYKDAKKAEDEAM